LVFSLSLRAFREPQPRLAANSLLRPSIWDWRRRLLPKRFGGEQLAARRTYRWPAAWTLVIERVRQGSIAWSGCNSTLESLTHNLPMMGVTETIAETVDDSIRISVRPARDVSWRMQIKDKIAKSKYRVYRDRSCIVGPGYGPC